MPDALPPRRRLGDSGAETLRGIALANVCFLLLTVGDIATIIALPVAGVAGAMFGRGLIGALMVVGLTLGKRRGGLRRLLPVRTGLVMLRSLVHAGATLTWYVAWHLGMPLADSYALGYAAPLLMIVLAVPLLGERLGARRVAATGVGFLGMLVMLRPGGDLWMPVTLLVMAGVVGVAISRTLTRVLATTEGPECLAFWLMAFHVPVAFVLILGGFPWPGLDLAAAGGLMVLGVSNGVAHWLHSRASALAPVAALAPYEYVSMIWAVLLGYLAFAQVPSWTTIGGAGVVAAAGLDNLLRERRRQRAERTAPVGGTLAVPTPALAQRSDL